jgi:LPXTG-motif cell wall-anchored protein
MRVAMVCLALALAVPAIALGQAQSGTTGSGNGSQSGSVTNNQTNSQSAIGNGNQQNATNQNCVAGRDCVNNNVTNQNAAPTRTFERAPVVVRRARVRRVVLAHTGTDLTPLFLIGGLLTAGGFGVLTLARRRGIRSLV